MVYDDNYRGLQGEYIKIYGVFKGLEYTRVVYSFFDNVYRMKNIGIQRTNQYPFVTPLFLESQRVTGRIAIQEWYLKGTFRFLEDPQIA